MSEQYTPKYFIKKFEAIPEEKWCVGLIDGDDGAHCTLGHLLPNWDEIEGLQKVLRPETSAAKLNNGEQGMDKYGKTPRHRVLNFLYAKLRTAASLKD